MKKRILICLCVLPLLAAAQSIQVGDSVRVKRTTLVYLTGERPSTWVYDETHRVSQIGTKRFPNGVLLDIKGARSWLGPDDVIILGREEAPKPQPEPQPLAVVEPEPVPEPEPVVVPVPVVAPVVELPVEQPKEQPKTKIKKEKEPVKVAKTTSSATFQMMGNIGVLVWDNTYGLTTDMIFGARINPYVFVGGGFGVHGWLSGLEKNGSSALLIPVYADARGYLPIAGKNVAPYLELALGGSAGLIDKNQTDKLTEKFTFGLYTRAAFGLEFNSWTISLGYDYGPAHNAWLGWGVFLK